MLCGLVLGAASSLAAAESSSVREAISAAGNTPHESERLQILQSLSRRAELDQMLPVVAQWADGRSLTRTDDSRAAENGYLCWFISGQVQPADSNAPIVPAEPSITSPLHPLWALYRGRMLLWRPIQSGPLLRVDETRTRYYDEARRFLEQASRAFPENQVIRMYLGEPIP